MSIFEDIRDHKTDVSLVYQDAYVTAFEDKYSNTPIHILIIPNKKMESLDDITIEDEIYLGKILITASKIAKIKNINESGYRLITNCNKDGGQEIPYLHFHLIGGAPLGPMINLPKASKKIINEN